MEGDSVHHDGRAVKLSVLIASVSSRLATKMPRIFRDLERQAKGKDAEVLVFLDDRKRSIGRKRNALVSIAQGEFVSFVDDDDRVAHDYVDRLLERIGDGTSDSSSGEDTDWAHRICRRFEKRIRQERIDKVLYSYDFDTNDTSLNQ